MTNHFKRLDLVHRVPKELWMEVCTTVQEVVTKTIPKKNKYKKENSMSEEALQIAEKRREKKSKRDKERYTQLNAEFQRMARKDKKALSEQCRETEENNRMQKPGDLLKKIRGTTGTCHAKTGT